MGERRDAARILVVEWTVQGVGCVWIADSIAVISTPKPKIFLS